jgi:LacI family transcriptional regulator
MKPVENIIRSSREPVAFFCINDFIAIGVMKYLLEKKYRIPQDVALAGFDDIPLSRYLASPLTTINQPRLEMGQEAARLLINQLQEPGQKPRKVVLPVSLVQRDSSLAIQNPVIKDY